MNVHIVTNCSLIAAGAVIMLISLVGSKKLIKTLHFVPDRQQRRVRLYLLLHRTLMTFFLCGYLIVLSAFVFHYSFISETFVSLIFFLGSIFVFVGVQVQSRLMSEVQNTLQGILPICCKCNKIRNAESDPRDSLAWKRIEEYLTERTKVGFTHGLCPECFAGEIRELDYLNGKS
jgi:hypothetical protein